MAVTQKITTSFKTSVAIRAKLTESATKQGITISQLCEDIITQSFENKFTNENTSENNLEITLSKDSLEMIRLKNLEDLEDFYLIKKYKTP